MKRSRASPEILADEQAAIDAARAAGLKTQRERDYVDALATFFKDADKLNHRTRPSALATAIARLCLAAGVLIIAGKIGWDTGCSEGYKDGVVGALNPQAGIPAEHIDGVRKALARRRGEDAPA